MCRSSPGSSRRRRTLGAATEVEIAAGVDAAPLEESFEADQLPFYGVTECRCLLGDSGAAEKDHSRQETRKHQAYNREPQRMRQPDDAAQHRGHGVKRNAKQHSREN